MDTTTPAHPLIALLPSGRRRAHHLTEPPDQADDLLHEAILGVWQQMQRKGPIARLRPVLATALRKLVRQRRRALALLPPLARDDDPAGLRDVRAAIEHLPRAQRDLVLLVLSREISPADLARVTGLAPGTVMTQLAHARTHLRRVLGVAPGASATGRAP